MNTLACALEGNSFEIEVLVYHSKWGIAFFYTAAYGSILALFGH